LPGPWRLKSEQPHHDCLFSMIMATLARQLLR
jgi:hypothetical protein